MRRERLAPMALVLMAAAVPLVSADVWDATGDDVANATRNELLHGADQVHDLAARPGPVADVDWYRLSQQRHSSYEIVVDAAGGDLGSAGPILERVASDGSTVLQASVPAGAGASRSLRFENVTGAPINDQRVRVLSAGCGTDCGSEDGYRIRALDTTLSLSRVSNSGTQVTFVILQNTAAAAVDGHVNFWDAAGLLLLSQPFSIPGRGGFVFNSSGALPGTTGSATVSHTGAYGQIAGRATSVEPATGFTFDTVLESRPMPAQGSAGGRGSAALVITPPAGDYGSVFVGGSRTLTFTVRNIGAASSGVLATSLAGPDAGQFSLMADTCTASALPAGASCSLQGRFAPASGGPKSASLAVGGTPGGTATASLGGNGINGNPVFVTSTTYTPTDLGGLAGADAACQNAVAAGGLPPGTYRAWLSTSTVDAESRLGTARGFILTDGRPFTDTKTGLIASNAVLNPIVTDEFGATISVDDVWTGTLSSGGGGANNCADWTSSLPSITGTAGHSRGGPVSWTQHSFPTCDTPLPIYCFRTDLIVPVTVPPLPDPLAFVTSATFTLGPGGIAAADDFCGMQACGSLPCPFKAYLATTTGNAASRFTLTTYTRFDEVPVGGAAELDSAGPLRSGIWQHMGGIYISGTILSNRATWTGSFAANAAGTAATTCNDWTSNVGTGAYIGDPSLASNWWFGRAGGQDCSVPRRLYCIQD